MTTYSSLKYDHAFSSNAIGTGSLTLISSQTASASSSISFTNIDNTYDEYVFKFINIHPSAQSHLTFQGSTNSGSSYGVTCTSTAFHTYHNEADGVTVLGYKTSADLAQSTSYIPLLTENTGINNDDSYSGTLHIFNPSDNTFVKHFIASNNNSAPGGYTVNSYFAGYLNTTSAINAINFQMSSGNIDDGIIKLYGVS
jgi:hypothetical protein